MEEFEAALDDIVAPVLNDVDEADNFDLTPAQRKLANLVEY